MMFKLRSDTWRRVSLSVVTAYAKALGQEGAWDIRIWKSSMCGTERVRLEAGEGLEHGGVPWETIGEFSTRGGRGVVLEENWVLRNDFLLQGGGVDVEARQVVVLIYALRNEGHLAQIVGSGDGEERSIP